MVDAAECLVFIMSHGVQYSWSLLLRSILCGLHAPAACSVLDSVCIGNLLHRKSFTTTAASLF
jgi:hypothetical protein